MKPWYEVVKQARYIYINRDKFAYLYGANGEVPKTREEAERLINTLWTLYPTHFAKSVSAKGYTKEQLIAHIIGKRCYDCSAFICAVTQDENHSFYNLVVQKDYNSAGLKNMFSKTTSLAEGVAGSILWKNGHVALDTGLGIAIDFANEFVDVRAYHLTEMGFLLSGQLPWVDYTGSLNV